MNTILSNSVVASTKCLEKRSAKFWGTRAIGSKTISNGQPNACYSWRLETKGFNSTANKNYCDLEMAVERRRSNAFVGMQMHPFLVVCSHCNCKTSFLGTKLYPPPLRSFMKPALGNVI